MPIWAWVLLGAVLVLYLLAGLGVWLTIVILTFLRIHLELEPENFSKGLPIQEHVEMVMKKINEDFTILDSSLLTVLFWPLYVLKIFTRLGSLLEVIGKISEADESPWLQWIESRECPNCGDKGVPFQDIPEGTSRPRLRCQACGYEVY